MRKIFSLAAIALAALAAAGSATAATVIDGGFSESHHRLDCDCRPVEWTRHFRITLSGKNAVHEEWSAESDRSQSRTVEHDMELGKTAGRATWRVVGANRLERILNYPQHQTIMVIVTHGRSCDLQVEYRLKPGYSDMLAKRADNGQWAHYSLPQVQAPTCEIH
jgi:hypothetical protein